MEDGSYRIFIFNPETDYALACGKLHYNIPVKIRNLRNERALIFEAFASEKDAILIMDSPLTDISHLERGTAILSPVNVAEFVARRRKINLKPVFYPWGWNHTMREFLISSGIDEEWLPSSLSIDCLRNLSHRNTTIIFNKQLKERLSFSQFEIPGELKSVDEVMALCGGNERYFLKMPWSSSGRGVIRSDSFPPEKLKEWVAGAIRRQGSVMIEKMYDKTADFASEWWIDKGNASFLGLSAFNVSPEGRYLSNKNLSFQEITSRISSFSSESQLSAILQAQRNVLEEVVAPVYSGPVGIDMLTTVDRRLIPCIELNFRFTMGIVNLFNKNHD